MEYGEEAGLFGSALGIRRTFILLANGAKLPTPEGADSPRSGRPSAGMGRDAEHLAWTFVFSGCLVRRSGRSAKVSQTRLRGALMSSTEVRSMSIAPEHHGAFGQDWFGRAAERVARFFGTPQYIIGQTVVVVVWIAINAFAVAYRWDPYPFILLNLAFSTQAAYAAPLILLAQTRQADRDKDRDLLIQREREEMQRADEQSLGAIKTETDRLTSLLEANTDLTRQDKELTEQIADLTKQIHALLTAR